MRYPADSSLSRRANRGDGEEPRLDDIDVPADARGTVCGVAVPGADRGARTSSRPAARSARVTARTASTTKNAGPAETPRRRRRDARVPPAAATRAPSFRATSPVPRGAPGSWPGNFPARRRPRPRRGRREIPTATPGPRTCVGLAAEGGPRRRRKRPSTRGRARARGREWWCGERLGDDARAAGRGGLRRNRAPPLTPSAASSLRP